MTYQKKKLMGYLIFAVVLMFMACERDFGSFSDSSCHHELFPPSNVHFVRRYFVRSIDRSIYHFSFHFSFLFQLRDNRDNEISNKNATNFAYNTRNDILHRFTSLRNYWHSERDCWDGKWHSEKIATGESLLKKRRLFPHLCIQKFMLQRIRDNITGQCCNYFQIPNKYQTNFA